MKPVSLRYGQEAHLATDGKVIVHGQCLVTGKDYTIPSAISIDGLLAWSNGAHIQDALPELSKEEREFLISGTSPEGWAEMFPPGWADDDDEDDPRTQAPSTVNDMSDSDPRAYPDEPDDEYPF